MCRCTKSAALGDQRPSGSYPPFFLSFALIGLLAAAAAWSLVRSRARRPAAVMQVLVPVVVLVSLVPDLLVGLAGLGWTGAFALMLMHLSVAVCGVAALRRFLPLTPRATVVASGGA